MLESLINIRRFYLWCIYWKYSWHYMIDFPFTFGAIFYSTKTWYKLTTFMLALLCLYLIWYILHGTEKYPTSNISESWVQQHFNWKIQPINISHIYVRILCTCWAFIDSSIYECNSQHSMLSFHKENTVLLKKKCQQLC